MNLRISCKYKLGKKTECNTAYGEKNIRLPDCKLFYLEKGRMDYMINGQPFTFLSGDFIMIPPGIPHSYRVYDGDENILHWAHFELEKERGDIFKECFFPYYVNLKKDERYILEQFETLFKDYKEEKTLNDVRTASCILNLVTLFLSRCTVTEHKETNEQDQFDLIIEYINQNFAEQISIDELAKQTNYSRNHFVIKFKNKTGSPPLKYINLLRLENVKALLHNSEEPINKIMEKSGFMDFAYFSKLFKKYVGVSPQKFRNQMQKNIP